MTKVLYPGSFDPITKGHMDIVKQGLDMFDEVVIAVLNNASKKTPFFTVEERIELIKRIYENQNNVKVVSGSGAAVDIAKLYECKAILRGLRGLTDFDYEIQLANVNKKISNNEINTVCLFADPTYQFTSSSIVKEIFSLDKDVSDYVEPIVYEEMNKKLVKKRG